MGRMKVSIIGKNGWIVNPFIQGGVSTLSHS